jgi:hypothetical protein
MFRPVSFGAGSLLSRHRNAIDLDNRYGGNIDTVQAENIYA